MMGRGSFAMILSYPAGKPLCKIRGHKILHRSHVPAPDSFVVQKALCRKLSASHLKRRCSVARERGKKGDGYIFSPLSIGSASSEMTRKPEKAPSAIGAPSAASMILMRMSSRSESKRTAFSGSSHGIGFAT